ncbi:uncharacterized protein LOC118189813 [Stegodyphus dumicola]|uniref:uncharacterized protein LOC118189813 n=1 Tax=Stegodyphus dumicola TaxID=202533 RepID=UPI0015AA32A7|nr:uncharacterized protein LOC118189813 [Stegodyphus dumicola]
MTNSLAMLSLLFGLICIQSISARTIIPAILTPDQYGNSWDSQDQDYVDISIGTNGFNIDAGINAQDTAAAFSDSLYFQLMNSMAFRSIFDGRATPDFIINVGRNIAQGIALELRLQDVSSVINFIANTLSSVYPGAGPEEYASAIADSILQIMLTNNILSGNNPMAFAGRLANIIDNALSLNLSAGPSFDNFGSVGGFNFDLGLDSDVNVDGGLGINLGTTLGAGLDTGVGVGIPRGFGLNDAAGVGLGLNVGTGLGLNAGGRQKTKPGLGIGLGLDAGKGIGLGVNAGTGANVGLGLNVGGGGGQWKTNEAGIGLGLNLGAGGEQGRNGGKGKGIGLNLNAGGGQGRKNENGLGLGLNLGAGGGGGRNIRKGLGVGLNLDAGGRNNRKGLGVGLNLGAGGGQGRKGSSGLGVGLNLGAGIGNSQNDNGNGGIGIGVDVGLGLGNSDNDLISLDLSDIIQIFQERLAVRLLRNRYFRSIFSDAIPPSVLNSVSSVITQFLAKAFRIPRSYLLSLEKNLSVSGQTDQLTVESYAQSIAANLGNILIAVDILTPSIIDLQASIASKAVVSAIENFLLTSTVPGVGLSVNGNPYNSYFSALSGLEMLPYVGPDTISRKFPPVLKAVKASAFSSRFSKALYLNLISASRFCESFQLGVPVSSYKTLAITLGNYVAEAFGSSNPSVFIDMYSKALLSSKETLDYKTSAQILAQATAKALYALGYFVSGNPNVQAAIAANAVIRAVSRRSRYSYRDIMQIPSLMGMSLMTPLAGVIPPAVVGISADAGVGVDVGVGADVGVGVDADLGIDADVGVNAGVDVNADVDLGLDIGANADLGLNAGLDIGANAALDINADLDLDTDLDVELLGGSKGDRGRRRQRRATRNNNDRKKDTGTGLGIDADVDLNTDVGANIDLGADIDVGTDIDLGANVDIGADIGLDTNVDVGVGLDADVDVGVNADVGLGADLGVGVGISTDADNDVLSVIDVLPIILAEKLRLSTAMYTATTMVGMQKVVDLIAQGIAAQFGFEAASVFIDTYSNFATNTPDTTFGPNILSLAKATTDAIAVAGVLTDNFSVLTADQLATAIVAKYSSLIATSLEAKDWSFGARWSYLYDNDFIQPPLSPGYAYFRPYGFQTMVKGLTDPFAYDYSAISALSLPASRSNFLTSRVLL